MLLYIYIEWALVYSCVPCVCCASGGQKIALDALKLELEVRLGCKLQCGCWDLNQGPLEEQELLSITEPSQQAPDIFSTALVLKLSVKRE